MPPLNGRINENDINVINEKTKDLVSISNQKDEPRTP